MCALLFKRITNHPDNRTNERGGADISTVFICVSRLGQVADETGHMIGELDAHTCRKTKEPQTPHARARQIDADWLQART